MNSLTYIGVSAERERQVAHTSADMSSRQMGCYPLSGPYEVDSVVVVLLHTCGNGKHVRVEDDVERVHPHLIHQYMVSSLGYLDSALKGCGLSHLVEAHHHTGSSVSEHILGMSDKHFLALFERYGVDDTLALTALQSGSDDIPFGRVDHDGHFSYLGLGSYHIEEIHHLGLGIEQTVIHIDVYHRSPVSNLFTGYAEGFLITFLIDESQELSASCHIAPLTHIDKT